MMASKAIAGKIAAIGLTMIVAAEIPAAAADVLVLSATGPRAPNHYRPGSRHADNAIFELRPGDNMTVLARGGTRRWRGPGFYSLVAPPRPLVLANGQTVRVQTGVVRTEPPQPGVRPTDVWEYDVSKEGRLCVPAGAAPMLWRPRGATPQSLTVRAASGASRRISWGAGEYQAAWPAALPLSGGRTYILEAGRGQRPVRVTLVTLPAATVADTGALAAQLLARGCQAQLETLIATRVDRTAPVAEESASGARTTPQG